MANLPAVLDIDQEDQIKVAAISLAFNNKKVISLLKSRGQSLVNGQYRQLRKNEEQINKFVKRKKAELKRPVHAFVTWNSQEGYERCMKHLRTKKSFFGTPIFNKRKFEILDIPLQIREAPEPSDIIWENLSQSEEKTKSKQVTSYFLNFIVLAVVFSIFTVLKSNLQRSAERYPEWVECGNYE